MTGIISGSDIAERYLKEKGINKEVESSSEEMHQKIHSAVKARDYEAALELLTSHLENESHNKEAEEHERYSEKYREDGKDESPQGTKYHKGTDHTRYSS